MGIGLTINLEHEATMMQQVVSSVSILKVSFSCIVSNQIQDINGYARVTFLLKMGSWIVGAETSGVARLLGRVGQNCFDQNNLN